MSRRPIEPQHIVSGKNTNFPLLVGGRAKIPFFISSSFLAKEKANIREAIDEFARSPGLEGALSYHEVRSAKDLEGQVNRLSVFKIGDVGGGLMPDLLIGLTEKVISFRDEFGVSGIHAMVTLRNAEKEVMLHELGHTCGLSHPTLNTPKEDLPPFSALPKTPQELDAWAKASVMTPNQDKDFAAYPKKNLGITDVDNEALRLALQQARSFEANGHSLASCATLPQCLETLERIEMLKKAYPNLVFDDSALFNIIVDQLAGGDVSRDAIMKRVESGGSDAVCEIQYERLSEDSSVSAVEERFKEIEKEYEESLVLKRAPALYPDSRHHPLPPEYFPAVGGAGAFGAPPSNEARPSTRVEEIAGVSSLSPLAFLVGALALKAAVKLKDALCPTRPKKDGDKKVR